MTQSSVDQKYTRSISKTNTGVTATGGEIIIPAWVNEVTAFLIPNGTTAGVEYTCDDEATIAAGTAQWALWDAGQVTANTARAAVGPITGLRINQSVGAGTSTLNMVGQRRRI